MSPVDALKELADKDPILLLELISDGLRRHRLLAEAADALRLASDLQRFFPERIVPPNANPKERT